MSVNSIDPSSISRVPQSNAPPASPPTSPEAKPIIISNPTVAKAKEAAAKFNLPEYTDDAMKVRAVCLEGFRGPIWWLG